MFDGNGRCRVGFPRVLKPHQLKCREIVTIAKRLYDRNMLAAADGNISVRVSSELILITPSGLAKGFMAPESMAIVNLENQVIWGQASSERLMHLEVFRQCSKAMAVVHAHPPTVIAWSVARPELKFLPSDSLSEVILACGDIPFVPYARPGTMEMGVVLREFLAQYRALILSRHGALTWGESLDEAWRGMERIEHSAEILWRAHQLGGLTTLPAAEVEALRELRQQLGDQLL